jgi:hypothetical protein
MHPTAPPSRRYALMKMEIYVGKQQLAPLYVVKMTATCIAASLQHQEASALHFYSSILEYYRALKINSWLDSPLDQKKIEQLFHKEVFYFKNIDLLLSIIDKRKSKGKGRVCCSKCNFKTLK